MDADVWEPLLAVADAAGGEWPQRGRVSAVTLVAAVALVTALREGGEVNLGVRLLSDLRTVFGDVDAIGTKPLLAALHAMDEAPWGDLKGKLLDDRGLASRLRKYGVKPKTLRACDDFLKGYSRTDLQDPRGPVPPPSPATSVTAVTTGTGAARRKPLAKPRIGSK